jgi:hypothetical protein
MKSLLTARRTFGRYRPRTSAVVAVIALVFAMTGGAIASTTSPRATAANSPRATAAKAGKRGKRGPRGFTGPTGATGAAGPVTLTHKISAEVLCAANTGCDTVSPACSSGTYPVGGEILSFSNEHLYTVTSQEDVSVWFGYVFNAGSSGSYFEVGVICASASSATGFSETRSGGSTTAG